jgi:caspase domain-containing protein/PEGA domain-containing protein
VNDHRDIGEVEAPTASEGAAGRQVIAVIGIDRYRQWPALHNAVSDAEGALRMFRRLGFEDVAPPLLDDAATGDAIDALVTDDLATLAPNDCLIVFFAGHGGTRAQDLGGTAVTTGYLIPVDGDASPSHAASWIEVDGFLRRISKLPPLHILVVLDACHSGIALSRMVHWGRGSGRLPDSPFAALHTRRSRVVITSALDDERALDNGPVPGHSLFTGCLIEALTGGVPGVELGDGRRVASGSDLGFYVRTRVQTYPGAPGWRQTPDFGVFDYDQRGEMPIPLGREGDVAARAPAPPKLLAAGSAPTMLAAAPELLLASEPAFASGRRLREGEPPAERPSSPRLLGPPPAGAPAELSARPRSRAPMLAGLSCIALALLGVLGSRQLRTVPVDVAVIDPGDGAADGAASPDRVTRREMGKADVGYPALKAERYVVGRPGAADSLPLTGAARSALIASSRPPPPDATTSASARRGRVAKSQGPAPLVATGAAGTHPGDCFADVTSNPTEADIVHDGAVIGKTHDHLRLPCGLEITLSFQKLHYASTIKKVVATPEGTRVATRLSRITYAMHVESTPSGATITLAGKLLGVTPATVKVPASESVTLVVAKDGYASASKDVIPTAGGTVLATLAALPRRSP